MLVTMQRARVLTDRECAASLVIHTSDGAEVGQIGLGVAMRRTVPYRTVPYGTVKRYHTNCTNCTLYTVRTHNKLVQSVQLVQ